MLGFIVVAPSHGLGNWRAPASDIALRAALAAVSRLAAIDRNRVHPAGLSNGALAVSRLAGGQGSQFRSLIFLSPVFDVAQISGSSFAEQCRGQAVLVLTGEADDRVPLRYTEENVANLTRAGVHVRLKAVAQADHFLFFSRRELVINTLESWLQENRRAP